MISTLSKQRSRDLLAVLILALLYGSILHWPALTQSDRMHENWRQSPHWISPQRQQFQADDPFLKYARFNTSPFANWLYTGLARTGIDLFWGKLNAVLFFSATAVLIFLIGQGMCNRWGGWLAVIIFLFFPSIFAREYSGGFMSALSAPLLCCAVWVVHSRRWWWALPLMLLQALVYPMVMLHSGLIFCIDIVFHNLKQIFDARQWRAKFLPLLLAATAGLLMVYAKYQTTEHEYGHLVTRHEIRDRLEFTSWGRAGIIPVKSPWEQVEREWGHWFHLFLFITAFWYLGRGVWRLPRGLYALLLASLVLYVLADIFLIRLYFPNRYLRRALPIFMALAGGYWLARAWMQESPGPVRFGQARLSVPYLTIFMIGLGLVGLLEFHHRLKPGQVTWRYTQSDLYAHIRSIPGRPLLAVHPRAGDEIPVMAGKSILVSEQLTHPYWTTWWQTTSERARDFFTAYYATDPAPIQQVTKKYGIDYWIIMPVHFTAPYLALGRRIYMEPFNKWIRRNLKPSSHALLNRVPPSLCRFNNGRYQVVESDKLLHWLDTLPLKSREAFP